MSNLILVEKFVVFGIFLVYFDNVIVVEVELGCIEVLLSVYNFVYSLWCGMFLVVKVFLIIFFDMVIFICIDVVLFFCVILV